MYHKIKKTIENHQLIKEGDTVIIGVSGGADSIALLHSLLSYREECPFSPVVAHVNHGTRGRESDRDEDFVKGIAEKRNLPFESIQVDMVRTAELEKCSKEQAGRRLRYDFFEHCLKKYKAERIAVAHQMEDQAETLLLHLFRGSGLQGLTAMDYQNNHIIRPLLDCTRAEIESYLDVQNLSYRVDQSNFSDEYTRNHLRNRLFPILKTHYNPNIVQCLFDTANRLRIDQTLSDRGLAELLERSVQYGESSALLKESAFQGETDGLLKRILRSIIEKLNGHLTDWEEVHLDEILKLRSSQTGKAVQLHNLEFSKTAAGLEIYPIPEKKENPIIKFVPKWNETIEIDYNEYKLIFEWTTGNESPRQKEERFEFSKSQEITIRERRRGDRMQPFGMSSQKKISDIFVDQKIPQKHRSDVPVIEWDHQIQLLGTIKRSNHFRVTANTEKILKIVIVEGE